MSQEVHTKRYEICKTCDYLVDPPSQMAYKIVFSKNKDRRICNKCGCVAVEKAWLPSEDCPIAEPGNSGFSLWGPV